MIDFERLLGSCAPHHLNESNVSRAQSHCTQQPCSTRVVFLRLNTRCVYASDIIYDVI